MHIKGRVFLVTGGASGLGEAAVRHFIAKGAKGVTICDVNDENGKKLEGELGAHSQFCHTDVCDEGSVQKALEATVKKFGALHCVINCAGGGMPQRVLSSKGTVASLKHFNSVVQLNLIGTFNVLSKAAAIMAKQDPVSEEKGERGTIINVASVAAFEGQIGQASYSASKGAIVAMTLPIARELGALGIRINTIAPGIFGTPLLMALPDKVQSSLTSQVPFPNRLGLPKEFAELCGTIVENAYLNGTVLRIDGGIRMSAM